MPYTYIVECADGTYYTGWAQNLDQRIAKHNLGDGARYTRGRIPVKLVYAERHDAKGDAQKRECQIKKLSRAEKERLIRIKSFEAADCRWED